MTSSWEAELVECWIYPRRTSACSSFLVRQPEFRPSHCRIWWPLFENSVCENIDFRSISLKLKAGHQSILGRYLDQQGHFRRRWQAASDSERCLWPNQCWMWASLTLQASLPVCYMEAELISIVLSKPFGSWTIQCGAGLECSRASQKGKERNLCYGRKLENSNY